MILARALSMDRLRVTLLFVAAGAAACVLPAQADTYWHLRAGQDLLRTGHVALVETYSHTARGRPWPNHEWLWQAFSYAAYRAGGMPLLTAMAAALAIGALGFSYHLMRGSPRMNFVLALFGAAMVSVVWAVRPQVASLFLLGALVSLLARHCLWPLPPLFVLWANLHGAVALGGAVLVTATLVSALDGSVRGRTARLAVLTVVCGLLTAATPMGTELWRFIGESMARSRDNQILEWQPAYPRGPVEIVFALAALGLVVLVATRWRRLRSWDDRLVVAVALLLVPLAARAVRNIAPFALMWMPAASRLLRPAPAGDRGSRHPCPTLPPVVEQGALNAALLAGVLALAAGGVVTAWRMRWERLGWQPLPPALVAALRGCRANLYNRYDDGGYLIWFAPEVPVFIDSRQDPYPAELLSAQAATERSGDYAELFRRHDVGCAMLPTTSPVARHLATDGWLALYRDATWIVQRSRAVAAAEPGRGTAPATSREPAAYALKMSFRTPAAVTASPAPGPVTTRGFSR